MTDEALLLGLERMKSHAPLNAIDPLLCVFADRELTKAAVSVLTAHYDVLNGYAQAIFGNISTNPAFSRPALPEHNKYALFIRERYAHAMRTSKEFEKLGENCRPHNSQVSCEFQYLIPDFSVSTTWPPDLRLHQQCSAVLCQLQLRHFAELHRQVEPTSVQASQRLLPISRRHFALLVWHM
jgi:hypothetical protein